MVALKTERKVLLLQSEKGVVPDAASSTDHHTLESLLKIIETRYKTGSFCVELLADGSLPGADSCKFVKASTIDKVTTGVIYIADMNLDTTTQKCQFLFARADASVSNPAFVKADGNKVRIVTPDKGEAVGFSAHMTLDYSSTAKQVHGQRTVLEKTANLSRSLIFEYLNAMLTRHSRDNGFEYELKGKQKGKNPEKRPYRLSLTAMSKPSASLKEDIKKGNVSMIELIDNEYEFVGIDKNDKVKKVSRVVKLSVDFPKKSKGLLDFLNKTSRKAKDENFDEIVVRIRNLPGGTSSSPRFNVELEDAAEMLYSKIEILEGFKDPLEQCYTTFCKPISDKIDGKLSDNSVWK